MNKTGAIGVIALVPDRWDDVAGVRHQVLKRLADRYPVAWIEPPRSWREFVRPGSADFLAADRWHSPAPGLEVLAHGLRHAHFYRPGWLGTASARSRLASAHKRLRARGARRILLYLWRDDFADAVDQVEHDAVLYHIDDEYTFSAVDVPISAREAALIRRADDVIVHSARLFEKKSGINPHTFLVPNGVDYDAFAAPRAEPADLAGIPHPRIGYAGVIKLQLDLGLLDSLAAARPDLSFVLVGPVGNVDGKTRELEALKARPNVHFLGRKTVEELGAYPQHFDVCLMCYEVNAYTHCIYPLKLHEYLASGRPAVSSRIRSVVDHADVVRIADGPEDWLKEIDAALGQADNTVEASERRRARAREFEWSAITDRIAAIIESRVSLKFPARHGAAARALHAPAAPADASR